MLRFSGSGQNPGSSILDELQLSNGLLWKAGEETITIIHPAGDQVKSSQVTFIYIALLTIQIVSKHLTVSSWRIECQ